MATMARSWAFLLLLSIVRMGWAVSFSSNGTTSRSSTITGSPTSTSRFDPPDQYTGLTDSSLSSFCHSRYTEWYYATTSTLHSASRVFFTGLFSTTTLPNGEVTSVQTSASWWTTYFVATGNYPRNGYDFYTSTAEPPCCSSCTIAGQSVRLFFWPTPAPTPAVSTIVEDGFTFVSPSVYIAFTDLHAIDLCGQVGSSIGTTTLAFGPTELLSVASPVSQQTNSAGVVTSQVTPPPRPITYADLMQNCSTTFGYYFDPNHPFNTDFDYDECHPTIIIPSGVYSLQSAWETCIPDKLGGFYDPPHTLVSATGFTPTSEPQPGSSPTNTPSETALPISDPSSTPPPDTQSDSPPPPSSNPPTPTDSDSSSDSNQGGDPSSNPEPSSDPGTDPDTDPSTDPGASPDTDPNTDPSTNPETDPESSPNDPGSNAPSSSGGAVIVGGSTLPAGGATTLTAGDSTVVISQAPTGSGVIVGSSTIAPGGSTTLTVSGSAVVVSAGSTPAPGPGQSGLSTAVSPTAPSDGSSTDGVAQQTPNVAASVMVPGCGAVVALFMGFLAWL